jgi:hypothetical protein
MNQRCKSERQKNSTSKSRQNKTFKEMGLKWHTGLEFWVCFEFKLYHKRENKVHVFCIQEKGVLQKPERNRHSG